MAEKVYEYEGWLGRFHVLRDAVREKWSCWKESHPGGLGQGLKTCLFGWLSSGPPREGEIEQESVENYSHIYRRKTRLELIRVSAAVMGIEFSYAAETAFVSPTLLKIGVEHQHMTLVWALSPLVGFFLTPILGSLSDQCRSKFGRRRPFIISMSLGVLIGLILVPNGELLGYIYGDPRTNHNYTEEVVLQHRTSAVELSQDQFYNESLVATADEKKVNSHPWGVFFTILGTVLLDFDADACQSPARAYLLDVTVHEDHARGLSTFTIMAGLGGFLGYALGGINWDITFIGDMLGGHVRAVFSLITVIFVVCISYTVTCFKEIPLSLLESQGNYPFADLNKTSEEEKENIATKAENYGSVDYGNGSSQHNQYADIAEQPPDGEPNPAPPVNASFMTYLKSIIYMPHSLRMLCLTNLFCWMAHVCYSLYFTDFVGEAVFNGNPSGPDGSLERENYEAGIRFGCWGMSMYSLSCAFYSSVIDKLIARFRAKNVYVGGLLVYSTGMMLMALTKHKVGVILFSWTAGVMYSTLFTMPYLLVAHYHAKGTFEVAEDGASKLGSQIRGLGTDVALVSSMVFMAQFILSMLMGTIVSLSGTTTAVVSVASALAFFGAISATRVMYLDL